MDLESSKENLEKFKDKVKDKKIFFLRVLPLMMIPILFVLTIISTHSTKGLSPILSVMVSATPTSSSARWKSRKLQVAGM